jgi:serine phosphatase RsbU (regulator of sigma subunit)
MFSARRAPVSALGPESAQLLLDAVNAFVGSRSSAELLESLMRICSRSVGCSRISVNMLDRDRDELRVVASMGDPALPVGVWIRYQTAGGPLRDVIDGARTVLFDYEDPQLERSAEARSRAAALGFVNVLTVPLVAEGEVVGSFGLDEPFVRHEFMAEDIEIAEAIAAKASLALQNIRLLERERESARLAERLAALDAVIHSSLDSSTIFERVVSESMLAVGANAAALERRDGDRWPITHCAGLPGSVLGGHLTGGEPVVSIEAMEAGRVLAIEDVPNHHSVDMLSVAALGIASLVAVPLVSKGAPIGTLIWTYREPQRFGPQLLGFAASLGASLSLALDNARLYERERTVALTLQEALLRLPATVEGVEFATAYGSATRGARVGGDFYDLFELGDGRLGVTIGDVAGHGVSAAVLTSEAKHSLRALAFSGASPSEAVATTNRLLCATTPPEVFVTLFFGILDPASGDLAYCNAGHVDILVIAPGAPPVRLPAGSPIIGVQSTLEFAEHHAHVPLGALLFLYTDGIIEARLGSGECFGQDRLERTLAEAWDGDPQHAVSAVFSAVDAYSGSARRDDTAVLALTRSTEADL